MTLLFHPLFCCGRAPGPVDNVGKSLEEFMSASKLFATLVVLLWRGMALAVGSVLIVVGSVLVRAAVLSFFNIAWSFTLVAAERSPFAVPPRQLPTIITIEPTPALSPERNRELSHGDSPHINGTLSTTTSHHLCES